MNSILNSSEQYSYLFDGEKYSFRQFELSDDCSLNLRLGQEPLSNSLTNSIYSTNPSLSQISEVFSSTLFEFLNSSIIQNFRVSDSLDKPSTSTLKNYNFFSPSIMFSKQLLELVNHFYIACVGDIQEMEKFLYSNKASQKGALEVMLSLFKTNSLFSHKVFGMYFENDCIDLNDNLIKKKVFSSDGLFPIITQIFSNLILSLHKPLNESSLENLEEYFAEFINLNKSMMKCLSCETIENNKLVLPNSAVSSNVNNKFSYSAAVPYMFNNITTNGFLKEQAKVYEFNFNHFSEMPSINETINFKSLLADAMAVEIEIKTQNGEKLPTSDLILVSSDHSYFHLKLTPTNNYNSFGTCFSMKWSSLHVNNIGALNDKSECFSNSAQEKIKKKIKGNTCKNTEFTVKTPEEDILNKLFLNNKLEADSFISNQLKLERPKREHSSSSIDLNNASQISPFQVTNTFKPYNPPIDTDFGNHVSRNNYTKKTKTPEHWKSCLKK